MWYVFPQVKGIKGARDTKHCDFENMSQVYAYFTNQLLHHRLLQICDQLMRCKTNNPETVFGYPDYLKFQSSLTIFLLCTQLDIFQQLLDKYYNGEVDPNTVQIVNSWM